MTKAAKKVETVEDLEFHSDMFEMCAKYFGSNVKFELKGLNHYALTATNLIPELKTVKGKVRRPSLKLEILIQQAASEDEKTVLRQYKLTHGKKSISTVQVTDKKKYTGALEETLNKGVAYITECVSEKVRERYALISDEISSLHKSGELYGLYNGIPDPAYHQTIGVSKSQLSTFIEKTYNHFAWEKENKKTTEAMTLGSASHTRILTPELFDEEVAVAPDINKVSKDNKIIHARFEMENAHKYIIKASDAEMLERIYKNVQSHPVMSKVLKEGQKEVAAYWKNQYGKLSRGKFDGIIVDPSDELKALLTKMLPGYAGQSIVYDFKTDLNAKMDVFSKTIANRNYHIQAPYYIDGASTLFPGKEFIFLFFVVEKDELNEIAWYALDKGSCELGRQEYTEALENLYVHQDNPNMWHGHSLKGQWISVPSWKFK